MTASIESQRKRTQLRDAEANSMYHRACDHLPALCVLLAVAVALLVTGCADGVPQAATEPLPDFESTPLEHVGLEVCSQCHAAEAELWQGSHHDLAMQPAAADTVLADFSGTTFTYAGITSTFYEKPDDEFRFWVRTEGAEGDLEDFPIRYTFGVEPLQQYLVEFEDGRVQALSICWDTRPASEGGQRWFHLYPEEKITAGDPLHWTGIYQNWNFMCADCHSTNLEKGYDLASDTYDTTWSEIDVSCEACHGPGSRHLAWAEAELPKKSLDDSLGLVAPLRDRSFGRWAIGADSPNAVLTVEAPRPEIEACARCHARRTPVHPSVEHGKPFLDSYRPVLLEEPLYHADGQILDEVYVYGSFVHSKMFQQGVSCNDCHEPHSLELRGTTETVCAQCHQRSTYYTTEHHKHEENTEGSRCVSCHMAERNYMVVDGRRDHSFRVPRPDLTVEIGTPNACSGCHDDQSAAWAAAKVSEWYPTGRSTSAHFGQALAAARGNQAPAEAWLVEVISDLDQPPMVRATALVELAGFLSASSFSVVQNALADPDALVRLAAVSAFDAIDAGTRFTALSPLLGDPVRAVRVEAARVLSPIPREPLNASQRDLLDAALLEYEAAQQAVIDRPEAHLNLGAIAAQRGDFASARQSFEKALDLAPGFAAAVLNLADLARQEGRDHEGVDLLRRAIVDSPEDPRLQHALGLAQIRTGSREDSLEALALAADLAPREPRYAYVYGVALNDLGQPQRARAVLEANHERNPAHRETLLALLNYAQASGDTSAALRYAQTLSELAPEDRQLRALVERLQAAGG